MSECTHKNYYETDSQERLNPRPRQKLKIQTGNLLNQKWTIRENERSSRTALFDRTDGANLYENLKYFPWDKLSKAVRVTPSKPQ